MLRAGLLLLESAEQQREEKLLSLRAAVRLGFDNVEAGEYTDLATAADREAFWDGVRTEVAAHVGG